MAQRVVFCLLKAAMMELVLVDIMWQWPATANLFLAARAFTPLIFQVALHLPGVEATLVQRCLSVSCHGKSKHNALHLMLPPLLSCLGHRI